ncbi:hypothetical protein GCM10023149_25070 [Mucilaginibacter gynuensis]|uniref:Uncharacterized protein n=1 Tax=Mucilaginibacter gynuensis TaxID=1302236 RepID=A0ABP8GGD3_9SPHI
MSTNQVIPNGFIITISKVAEKEKEIAPMPVSARQLGEHIVSFIESRIPDTAQLNVKLNLESWDETYDNEEFMLQFEKSAGTVGDKDFSTNYWIEI